MPTTEEVRFESGDSVLAGTLHLPSGSGPHPALVMIQGSGPADLDSLGYFPPIRDHFISHGLAVLSWDKPGIGESTGHWTNQTVFDRADEALAGIKWLRSHHQIDPDRVGIWGHSQGGWVGPLAASQTRDLAILIVNSGPAITFHEQDLYGIEHTLRADGASDEEIANALQWLRRVHDAANRGAPYSEVASQLFDSARGTRAFEYFDEVEPDLWHFFVINSQRPYDPVPSLEQITCPILAIFGESDPLVPAAQSAEAFEALRETAPDRDVTVRIFPGANHRIRSGDPNGFAPGYLEMMTDWIWQRIGATR
jgi:pimeloyl-ACP methyl ester carboxylesterase